ncbi:MAG: hypothetical protein J6U96_05235, partial [Elusimicrobiaceae bacterium]|nr:hypothetical protein [Elusimicrobiaceae bacterium]
MKKIILLVALFFPVALFAQMSSADSAYDKGNFAEALTAYQKITQTAHGEDLYKAQLRVIASQYMQGEYLNAAKSAFTTKLPPTPIWQARLLLYRIQTAERVAQMYRPITAHADEETDEFENLSTAQWNDKINESFEILWKLRSALIYAPLDQETLILDVKNTDLQAIPTLFDFVVLKWKERLQYTAPVQPLRTADVLSATDKIADVPSYDVQKLLAILAEAAKLGGSKRADARIIWQVDRLVVPFEQERFFTFDDKKKQRTQVITELQNISGYPITAKTSLLDKISNALLRSSKTDYGRSYAALKAAHLLNDSEEFSAAVALCDWTNTYLSKNYYNESCANLAADIRKPFVNVSAADFTQNPADTSVAFSVRNAPHVYARLYRVTQTDLRNWNQAEKATSWNYLTYLSSKQIPELLKRTPLQTLSKDITYAKAHAIAQEKIILPELTERGFYAIVLSYDESFDTKVAPVSATVLNATDLTLFVTAAIEDNPLNYHAPATANRTPNVFRIYSVNLKTGEPEANADITYFTDWKSNQKSAKTNTDGLLTLPQQIKLTEYNSYSILPKAAKNNSTALLTNRAYFSFNAPTPVKLYTETDRAIYRPGQTVQLAVYGFHEAGRGLKTLPANSLVQLVVRDANYEKVLDKTLSLNAYGTAQTQLTLPETGLLGHYQVQVSYKENKRTF